jgi:hypothetical protein
MAKNEQSFSKNKQPKKRSPRSKGKKTLMLDAIRAQVKGGELEFLKKVVEHAMGDPLKAIAPNPQLLTLVLQRVEPPFKATMPMVDFEFDSSLKPHEQAAQVLGAASSGELSPDIANIFIQSIKSMIDIEEYTDLKERIEAIEKSLGVSND